MAAGGTDVKQLLLQVDASVALAQRGLNQLAAQVQRDATRMDQSLARVDGATSRLGAGFTRLNNLAGQFGVALGVGTVIAAGRSILQYADDLEAASDRAGVGIERFQTLTEAFRTLEVDTNTVDRTFQRLQATLGDVQNGVDNSATAALERLGIRSRILNGEITTSDQLLDAIAASARGAGTQAQFASEMAQIFGRRMSGELVPALRDGGQALHELEEATRQAGIMTEEQAASLSRANERLDQFWESTKRNAAIWAAELIGYFDAADAALRRFAASRNERQRESWITAGEYADQILAHMPGLAPQYARGAARLITGSRGESTSRRRIIEDVTGPGGWDRLNGLPARSGGGGFRSFDPADFAGMPDAAEMERIAAATRDLFGSPTIAATSEAISKMVDDLDPMPSLGDMLPPEEADRISLFAEDLRRDVAGSLAEVAVYGRNLGDALIGSIQRASSALLESALFELLGGLGGNGKVGGTGGAVAAIGSLVGALFGGGKAGGGEVGPGKWYMVGERGPETFVPKVPGVIIPNGGRVGGEIHIHQYIQGNMVTSEFMQRVDAMGVRAAREGAAGGAAIVYRRADRTLV